MGIFDKFKKKSSVANVNDIEADDKFIELISADNKLENGELETGSKDTFIPDGVSIFKINGTEFGIGKVRFELTENGRLQNLEIWGSEKVYDEIKEGIDEDEPHPWDWILYPPHVYFWEVDLPIDNSIVINEDLLDEHDIALYLMEHADFYGSLTITNEYIKIKAEIGDSFIENPRTLEIWISRKSL